MKAKPFSVTIREQQLKLRKLNSSAMILAGFAAFIILGTLILMLPFASADGRSAGFLDSLFTATSAVCVTGLVVRDTATGWSLFGQVVIIFLIQVGGLGVITVLTAIAMATGRKINLMQRNLLKDSISVDEIGGVLRMVRFILRIVLLVELAGALLLSFRFIPEFGFIRGLWYSVFHAISAFCNAGFDLMGIKEPGSSLTSYIGDPLINITIMALIILGGLGFGTWRDILRFKGNFYRYRLQSKIILIFTTFLFVAPAIYFFFGEFTSSPLGERILASLFQSVTARTAGFNTVSSFADFSETGQGLMILLMLIGGAPGSTAGGMKVTTFAVMAVATISVMRQRKDTDFAKRRIPDEVVRAAASILCMYLVQFLVGGFVISKLEARPLLECLFETASACGTVGVTTGITSELGDVSHVILILLMYFGRVGGLTMAYGTIPNLAYRSGRLVPENITVG